MTPAAQERASREVLKHFQYAAEQYGVTSHVHFQTNVSSLEIVGGATSHDRYYKLRVDSLKKGWGRDPGRAVQMCSQILCRRWGGVESDQLHRFTFCATRSCATPFCAPPLSVTFHCLRGAGAF